MIQFALLSLLATTLAQDRVPMIPLADGADTHSRYVVVSDVDLDGVQDLTVPCHHPSTSLSDAWCAWWTCPVTCRVPMLDGVSTQAST
jgi:hypothetical protein